MPMKDHRPCNCLLCLECLPRFECCLVILRSALFCLSSLLYSAIFIGQHHSLRAVNQRITQFWSCSLWNTYTRSYSSHLNVSTPLSFHSELIFLASLLLYFRIRTQFPHFCPHMHAMHSTMFKVCIANCLNQLYRPLAQHDEV